MPDTFDLSPHLQTLASSLLQQALDGEQTTGKPVRERPKARKPYRRVAHDWDMSIPSPFTVAAREIAVTSGVPPEQWLNRSHPLNDKLYLRMAELAGVPVNADPPKRRIMPSTFRSIYP